jgi:hypothetical protein
LIELVKFGLIAFKKYKKVIKNNYFRDVGSGKCVETLRGHVDEVRAIFIFPKFIFY